MTHADHAVPSPREKAGFVSWLAFCAKPLVPSPLGFRRRSDVPGNLREPFQVTLLEDPVAPDFDGSDALVVGQLTDPRWVQSQDLGRLLDVEHGRNRSAHASSAAITTPPLDARGRGKSQGAGRRGRLRGWLPRAGSFGGQSGTRGQDRLPTVADLASIAPVPAVCHAPGPRVRPGVLAGTPPRGLHSPVRSCGSGPALRRKGGCVGAARGPAPGRWGSGPAWPLVWLQLALSQSNAHRYYASSLALFSCCNYSAHELNMYCVMTQSLLLGDARRVGLGRPGRRSISLPLPSSSSPAAEPRRAEGGRGGGYATECHIIGRDRARTFFFRPRLGLARKERPFFWRS
jgi:hypothetical protein